MSISQGSWQKVVEPVFEFLWWWGPHYCRNLAATVTCFSCRGVQPAAHGLHAAQDGCECSPTQNCKFTQIVWDFFVITCHNVFNVWPKTTLFLPLWPRDSKRSDTPRSTVLGPKRAWVISNHWEKMQCCAFVPQRGYLPSTLRSPCHQHRIVRGLRGGHKHLHSLWQDFGALGSRAVIYEAAKHDGWAHGLWI